MTAIPTSLPSSARVYPHWFCGQQDWVSDPVHSGSTTYNFPFHLRIRGPLNYATLQHTIREIVRRQEMFRSTFSASGDELLWWVSDPVEVEIPQTDLRHVPQQKALVRAAEIATGMTLTPFNFSSGLLLRTNLIRISDHDHILLLVSHHLVFDDWSVGVFYKEFTSLYHALRCGKSEPIPETSFQYSQFLDLQSRQLKGSALARRVSFWRKQLDRGGDFHHLAKGKVRHSRLGTQSGTWTSASIPHELASRIRTLGQQNGVTLFMVLLAGFQVLLYRVSGDTDIGVGTCAANRARLEIQSLIGRFGNDLVLRINFSDNPTFRELLARTRRTCLEGFSYQDLPFATLAEELAVTRDPNRNPMFQVMFILRDAEKAGLEIPGLEIERFNPPLETTKYDLSVWLDMDHGIEVGFEYNRELFHKDEIARMQKTYRAILESMTVDPDVHIAEFSIDAPGKLDQVSQLHSTTAEHVPPRTPTEQQLCEMWASLLKVDAVGIKDNFFQLGGGSLVAAQLCQQIELVFGRTLSLAAALEGPTVEQLANLLVGEMQADAPVRVVPLQPRGSNPPFLCVCLFVGSGPIFLPLTNHLGNDQPFIGIVLDNSLARELPRPYSLSDVAQHIVRAIRTHQRHGPYFLGGFCGDGVLAFEAAQLLRQEGEEVALLALFEAQTRSVQKEFQGKRAQLRSIGGRFAPRQIRRHLGRIASTALKSAPDYLLVRVRDLKRDLLDICWQAAIDWNLRLHRKLTDLKQVLFVAEGNYCPKPYDGNVIVFRCKDYRTRSNEDRYGGWQQVVTGSIQLWEIEGDHLGILNEPNVKSLARMLFQCLQEAQTDDGQHAPQKIHPPPVREPASVDASSI
jgi:thioesterase domain-containing protein